MSANCGRRGSACGGRHGGWKGGRLPSGRKLAGKEIMYDSLNYLHEYNKSWLLDCLAG